MTTSTPTTTQQKPVPRVTLELPLSGRELLDPSVYPDTPSWALYRAERLLIVAWEDQHHLTSCDRIEMGRVRGLFKFAGRLWVCMGQGSIRTIFACYEVVSEELYGDETFTYWEKTKAVQEGRVERHPYYRGLKFTYKGHRFVITEHTLFLIAEEPPNPESLARCIPIKTSTGPSIDELAPLPSNEDMEQPSLFGAMGAPEPTKGRTSKKQTQAYVKGVGDLAPAPLPKTKKQIERDRRAQQEKQRLRDWAQHLRASSMIWDRTADKLREKLERVKTSKTREKYQQGLARCERVFHAMNAVADALEQEAMPPVLAHLRTQTAIEVLLDCPTYPEDARWYAVSNVNIERSNYAEARAAFLALIGESEPSVPRVEQAS